jgi:hypothetical protein
MGPIEDRANRIRMMERYVSMFKGLQAKKEKVKAGAATEDDKRVILMDEESMNQIPLSEEEKRQLRAQGLNYSDSFKNTKKEFYSEPTGNKVMGAHIVTPQSFDSDIKHYAETVLRLMSLRRGIQKGGDIQSLTRDVQETRLQQKRINLTRFIKRLIDSSPNQYMRADLKSLPIYKTLYTSQFPVVRSFQ